MRKWSFFKKKGRAGSDREEQAEQESSVAKYPRPKILLIDLKDQSKERLVGEGYNVSEGTFGTPYNVRKADGYEPVIPNGSLSNFTEQEIIVIDLVPAKPLDGPVGEKTVSEGKKDWWASCSVGVIDPRPRMMSNVQYDFERILAHGGVCVVFGDRRRRQDLTFTWLRRGSLLGGTAIPYDNWSFSSRLTEKHIRIARDSGREFKPWGSSVLEEVLSKHSEGSSFRCTFERGWKTEESDWVSLAESKYGEVVSVAIGIDNGPEKAHGCILIFPQIKNKAGFLSELVGEALPSIFPHLFPHVEGANWVHWEEYELANVLDLQGQIRVIEERAEKEERELTDKIADERERNGYLYDLLRETDSTLVQAVITALGVVGFTDVVDVDKELRASGEAASLREDIQVKDRSPALIVDVKGITGKPSDAEAMQSQKHASIRMKEWDRTDVGGLTIVNHQRHLPPLERENEMPFRKEILEGATQLSLGLMTTWDLYRLVRSFLKNGWKHEDVRNLFYESGRVSIVPEHYHYIGQVRRVWPRAKAVSVVIEKEGLKEGDRIGFELPVEFAEQIAKSLQLKDEGVTEAKVGDEVGIRVDLPTDSIRQGVRVYRVG
ncbi:MAG: hypothetical protein ACYTEX_08305 [Planctomycetota bacterium]|jgi:hypothetical protein